MTKLMSSVVLAGLLFCGVGTIYAGLTEANITDKTSDGSIIKTGDGVTWAIDAVDRIDTRLWMVTDIVIEDDDSSACTYYRLINKDENNETACAKKIQ